MKKAKQPVTIRLIDTDPVTFAVKYYDIEFDALITESQSYSSDVPSYPTEAGFNVSDTIIIKPLELSMTLYLTDTPVTWLNIGHGGVGWAEQQIEKLKTVYFLKKPVTLITSDRTYSNMAISSFELSKSADKGYAREIPMTFQEIRTTKSKTAAIPASYGKSGITGASAGAGNTTAGTSSSSSTSANSSTTGSNTNDKNKASVLYNIAKGAGVI